MHEISTSSSADDLIAAMRRFILDQAVERSDATIKRYEQTVQDVEVFIETVDVAPWLGVEIAAHLDDQRIRLGTNALVKALGIVSLVRVLPAFMAEPWLPPAGPQRRTHRVVARHVLKFLRLQCMQRSCFRREDFIAFDKALGYSYSHDDDSATRWAEGESDLVSCTLTLGLRERLIDTLLDEVSKGQHASIEMAIAARLNPVPVTIWMAPDEASERTMGW